MFYQMLAEFFLFMRIAAEFDLFQKKITVSLEGTYSNITKKVKRIYLSKLQLKYGIIDKAILN